MATVRWLVAGLEQLNQDHRARSCCHLSSLLCGLRSILHYIAPPQASPTGWPHISGPQERKSRSPWASRGLGPELAQRHLCCRLWVGQVPGHCGFEGRACSGVRTTRHGSLGASTAADVPRKSWLDLGKNGGGLGEGSQAERRIWTQDRSRRQQGALGGPWTPVSP